MHFHYCMPIAGTRAWGLPHTEIAPPHPPGVGMGTSIRKLIITGSTVVLTCCKGDCQSQWKTPIFGPPQLGNPLTDFDKI